MKKGQRLKVARATQDMTQAKVARKAGLNATRYWQIEHGEGIEPTGKEKSAIAMALGLHVSEIAWPALEDLAS